MIYVFRPTSEPPELAAQRAARLPALRDVVGAETFSPGAVKGYEIARPALFVAGHHKCWYCEKAVEMSDQPVEHFRPKATYWWLSWTWSNLHFACEQCNRHKGDRFELRGGTRLTPEEMPPGTEEPLLLDPSAEDPSFHIVFRPAPEGHWIPTPRNGSQRGWYTIKALKLDRADLSDLYREQAVRVMCIVSELHYTRRSLGTEALRDQWARMVPPLLNAVCPFAALSRDIFDHHFPLGLREPLGLDLGIRWTA